jgi:beta-xylosidase
MWLPSVALTLFLIGSALAEQFTNPVIYEDFADNDISRGPDGSYYLSASSFHYSPGAPILKSDDLVNWESIGRSVPSLSWSKYNLTEGQNAYNKGIWASTLRYRASNGPWYWIGCIEFSKTYIYTAPAVTGPWTLRSTLNKCYYDCGLLIDDDDSMYVVSGRNNITMAQLSADGL